MYSHSRVLVNLQVIRQALFCFCTTQRAAFKPPVDGLRNNPPDTSSCCEFSSFLQTQWIVNVVPYALQIGMPLTVVAKAPILVINRTSIVQECTSARDAWLGILGLMVTTGSTTNARNSAIVHAIAIKKTIRWPILLDSWWRHRVLAGPTGNYSSSVHTHKSIALNTNT